MELQVLNADNKPPNARQMNLHGRETTQGREEAQERKKLERHNEDKEMTDEKKLVQTVRAEDFTCIRMDEEGANGGRQTDH